jgi:hypothetical protein
MPHYPQSSDHIPLLPLPQSPSAFPLPMNTLSKDKLTVPFVGPSHIGDSSVIDKKVYVTDTSSLCSQEKTR